MTLRTKSQYLTALDDDREVWLAGERVKSVPEHPLLRGAAHSVGDLFELQHDPQHAPVLAYDDPAAGRVARSHQVPFSAADLQARGDAFRLNAQQSYGMMGRTPDFMNALLTAWNIGADVFGQRESAYADNVRNYIKKVADEDLCLTHALINPQVDRSKTAGGLDDPDISLHVVEERDDGIVVSGARLLATLAPLADEIVMSLHPGPPLKADEERFAVAFAIPLATPGLRMISRRSLHSDVSVQDLPLTARFEEMDCFVICERVLVPWDRAFVYRDVDIANTALRKTFTAPYAAHQTGHRSLVKLEFGLGLSMAIADTVGIGGFINVQEQIGEIADSVGVMRSAIRGAELAPKPNPNLDGTVMPDPEAMLSIRGTFPFVLPRLIEILQRVGASSLINTLDQATIDSPVGEDVRRYYQARNGSAQERLDLFKLAWDFTGSAFAGRQTLYERFFTGDPTMNRAFRYLGMKDDQELLGWVRSATGAPNRS